MHIEIEVAQSLEQALARLAHSPGLRPVAGATDVMLRLESGKLQAEKLLSIADLPELAYVRSEQGWLEIGALTLVSDLLDRREVADDFPALAWAAREFASPQIRNRATVGGNLANASPAADLVPPLIALGAAATLRSIRGERSLPVEELFAGPGRTRLEPGELVTSVRVPRRRFGFQHFVKFGNRGANVIAIVNASLALALDGETIREARAAYGCCAPVPLRAASVERALAGRRLDESLIAGIAQAVRQDVRPIDDVRGSRRYKERLAINATEDALARALSQVRRAA
jgi:CO/xanthine dehydrogenase FAD-binding subunit